VAALRLLGRPEEALDEEAALLGQVLRLKLAEALAERLRYLHQAFQWRY
jgi:hypothetical protein